MTALRIVGAGLISMAIAASGAATQQTSAKPASTPQPKPAGTNAVPTLVWPAAVEKAFNNAYPNATIRNVMKEKSGGKDVYEVESVDGGRGRDILYRPDGTMVMMEEELAEAELPEPVAAALKKSFPKAAVTRRERLTENGAVRYEIQLKGAKVAAATFTPDGKIVK